MRRIGKEIDKKIEQRIKMLNEYCRKCEAENKKRCTDCPINFDKNERKRKNEVGV